ncbi:GGDEF domain-containing protein [Synechococcus sp. CB0101]|uniref:GGDEF domain-containing protein n=1 Tax=Synechococcus sp. CB0101 TaxID=232348 RepID=UPI001FEF96BC|nr:GGDEF domain-containing protein [Synechococcus sp. CB0101]
MDALTGIANRRGFEQELEHRWQRFQHASTSALVLCLLDLDGFKEINDTLGHEAGDQLLITVAQRLRCSLRDSDFVARLGGDEFVLLLDQRTDRGSVETALQRLVVAIAEPMIYADTHMRVTASLGCVVIRSNDTSQPSEAELLRCADQAMYAAKRSGKNRWRLVRLGLPESDPQPDPQQILEQQSV